MSLVLPSSRFLHICIGTVLFSISASAQNPTGTPAPVRPIPPPGVKIPEGDRAELQAGVVALGKDLTVLRHNLQSKPEMLALVPDVMIFHKAVDWALRYDEFFKKDQVGTAKKLLELGNQRLSELKAGKPSWISATGLVPRGYLSKIDGSVQPYGMVIPDDWKPGERTPRRLDFWCHGRGETLSELDFINQRLTSKGEYTPVGALVLHLYGRYCCANKFTGETDLFEALENAKTHYNIDANKLVIRGFSMGGGSTWQFATHFAGLWAAANPGAGFGDTREFMKLGLTPDKPLPPAWEQTLWKWYDSVGYVSNLENTTTVAYSGEKDGQKEAADIMIRFARQEAGSAHPPMAELGKVLPGDGSPKADEARVTGTSPNLVFYHVIGPDVQHKIKPEAKPEVEKLVDAAVNKPRDPAPKRIELVTYTLVYSQMKFLKIEAMEKEWERAEVTAELTGNGTSAGYVLKTKNVAALSFGSHDLMANVPGVTEIDGTKVRSAEPGASFFRKVEGKWQSTAARVPDIDLHKRPGVCGPIDHAFMSSFVFVRPTGKPLNDKVGKWASGELEHAIEFWRKTYRGEAPVKDDSAVTADDIKNSNLILWGDPSSNKVLAQIITKLPLQWSFRQLTFGGQDYDPARTAPILIFPNPLNPSKYVVVNSGVTFREQALLNNADQTPKLPDWAIVDLNTPPDAKWPGEVKAAGFFDEQWKVSTK